jgi:uncharacterized protein (DUF488 family)
MDTPEFAAALDGLIAAARSRPVAYLRAERLWWQCHRRLLSDALTVRGLSVVHIVDAQHAEPHTLTPFLRIEPRGLLYAGLL